MGFGLPECRSTYHGIQREDGTSNGIVVGSKQYGLCVPDVPILTLGSDRRITIRRRSSCYTQPVAEPIETSLHCPGARRREVKPAGLSRPCDHIGLMRGIECSARRTEAYVAMSVSSICGFNQRETRSDNRSTVILYRL